MSDQTEVDAADTPDEVAELLRADPIVVQTVQGAGKTLESHDALATLREKSEVPVFVALTQEMKGLGADRPSADLASQLHRDLGLEGCYVVSVGSNIDTTCFGFDRQLEIDYEIEEEVRAELPSEYYLTPAGQAAQEMAVVGGLEPSHITGEDAFRTEIKPPRPGEQGPFETLLPWTLIPAVFLIVLLVARTVIWRGVAASRAYAKAGADQDLLVESTTRRQASTRRRLAGEIATLEGDSRRNRAAGNHLDLADRALIEARELLPSQDPLDLIGVEILIAIAQRALSSEAAGGYHVCGFNPTHKEASTDATSGYGRLPCCEKCRRDIDAGRVPASLKVGREHYFDRPSIWATTAFGALVDDLPASLRAARRAGKFTS